MVATVLCVQTQWGIHDQTTPDSNNSYEKLDQFPKIKATSKIPKPQTRLKTTHPTKELGSPHDRAELQTFTAWAGAAVPVSPTDL